MTVVQVEGKVTSKCQCAVCFVIISAGCCFWLSNTVDNSLNRLESFVYKSFMQQRLGLDDMYEKSHCDYFCYAFCVYERIFHFLEFAFIIF